MTKRKTTIEEMTSQSEEGYDTEEILHSRGGRPTFSPMTNHEVARPEPGIEKLDDRAWRQRLAGLKVERSAIQARVDVIWSRSLKGPSQVWALETAIMCTDLTSLEAPDTARRVGRLAARAVLPDPADLSCPSVAAVCVWPDLVEAARAALDAHPAGRSLSVAAVAGAFPSSRSGVALKAAEVAAAVESGADEIDIVLDRALFLAGRYAEVAAELLALRQAAGTAHLKVILETCELGTLDDVARASELALACGADFIKTSTGKGTAGATPAVIAVMLNAVRRWWQRTGERRGVKAAGGIRTAKDACRYLLLVHDLAGPEWCTPALWRFGASALLDDLCAQRRHINEGRYLGPQYFPIT